MEEGRGPRVPRSSGPKDPESQGPRYLKVTFKYELDSKEGPSCLLLVQPWLNNTDVGAYPGAGKLVEEVIINFC